MTRWIAAAFLFLFIQSIAEAQLYVSTAILDAYPNRDGSVSLAYRLELPNTGESSVVESFTLSLPSSKFRIEDIRAYRCDAFSQDQMEQSPTGIRVEKEFPKTELLPIRRHPDPQMDTEIVIGLGEHALRPNETADLCIDAVIPDYIARDFICADSAYVSIRPTIFYGKANEDTDIFMNIHIPEGIPAAQVLGQQEWPKEQIQTWLPVSEENGHAVVRWHSKARLSEIYWIAAIFPAGGIKTKPHFDGLQTETRVVPKETLSMDVTIQNDSTMRVTYDLAIENSGGCKPVDTVQLLLSGSPDSISAALGNEVVQLKQYPDIYPNLREHLGTTWYGAMNANLGRAKIAPGKNGRLRVRSVQSGSINLADTGAGRASLTLVPIASASGYWQPGSRWTTQVHFPKHFTANQVEPVTPGATKETNAGGVIVTWDQIDNPAPMTVLFPAAGLQNVNWDLEKADHWIFVLKHAQQFPKSIRTILIFLSPVAVFVLIGILRRALKKN